MCSMSPGGVTAQAARPGSGCSSRPARRRLAVPACGVIAEARGRRVRRLHDIPTFGSPLELVWRQRRYRCVESSVRFEGSARTITWPLPRAKLTVRAAWWAISYVERDNASVPSVARRLGLDWHTVWEAIKPLLEELANDPDRLARGRHGRSRRAHLASPAADRQGSQGADRDRGLDQA